MVSKNSADAVWGITWSAAFAISGLFIGSIMAEGTTTKTIPMLIIFILPLMIALPFWIVGALSRFKTFLMVGWFLTLYSTVYDLAMFLLLITAGLASLQIGDMVMMSLTGIGLMFLPLFVPGLALWYLIKIYNTSENPLRKDFVYPFSYFLGVVVFILQMSAYDLFARSV